MGPVLRGVHLTVNTVPFKFVYRAVLYGIYASPTTPKILVHKLRAGSNRVQRTTLFDILLDTRLRHVAQNPTSRHSRVELERVVHLADRIIPFRELRASSGQ